MKITKKAKIIWLTATVLSICSIIYNLRNIPTEELPPLGEGEYYCPPEIQANAQKLAPDPNGKWQMEAYNARIQNASSLEDAQRLQQEAIAWLENYNRRIREYNDYLKRNCR